MEIVQTKVTNSRRCTTCNKTRVCKYKENVTENVEKIAEGLEQKKLPLLVDISCCEWNGINSEVLR